MDIKKIAIAVIIILIVVIIAYGYISMNSEKTKIEVLSNSTLKNNDTFTIVLKNDYREVFPDQPVDIKILDDSGWAHKYNTTTNENGTASILLEGYDNGNYTVHTNFNGTLFLKDSKSVTNLIIDDGYSYYY